MGHNLRTVLRVLTSGVTFGYVWGPEIFVERLWGLSRASLGSLGGTGLGGLPVLYVFISRFDQRCRIVSEQRTPGYKRGVQNLEFRTVGGSRVTETWKEVSEPCELAFARFGR